MHAVLNEIIILNMESRSRSMYYSTWKAQRRHECYLDMTIRKNKVSHPIQIISNNNAFIM